MSFRSTQLPTWLFFALAQLTILLSISSGAFASTPRYRLAAIELLGYEGKALRLAVELPCGGEYYGLVARTQSKATLELGAVVRQDSGFACTSMPPPLEVVVDYLDTTGFKEIAPMPSSSDAMRINIVRISELGLVRNKKWRGAKSPYLQAVYEPKCGAHIGTLLRVVGGKQLGLAMVERPARGNTDKDCAVKPRSRAIVALDMKASYLVTTLREGNGSLRRAYKLRLARIEAGSVKTLSGKDSRSSGLRLIYNRACNEAPVGIVLQSRGRPLSASPSKADTERTVKREAAVEVGMLVAHYFNRKCSTTEPAYVRTVAEEHGLVIAPKVQLTLMRPSGRSEALKFSRPVEVAKVKGRSVAPKKAAWLNISYLQGCSARLGAVFARDAQGKLAVGVLSRMQTNEASPCKRQPVEVSWYQPFLTPQVRAQDLFPMQLRGGSAS